jgi:hypothetical protein
MVLIGTISHSAQPSRWWLVAAALLVVVWSWQRPAANQPAAAIVHKESVSKRAARHAYPAYHAAHNTQPVPTLALQLRDADDLMAFIERAKIDPASGGYYYALKAYDFCAREAKVAGRVPRLDELFSNAHGLLDVRQVSAWLRISALCRNFPESSRDMSYFALAEEGLTAGDPKLALALRLERLSAAPLDSAELRDADARTDLLTRIFAMHDPVLMRDLALELQVLQATVSFSLDDQTLTPEEGDKLVDALMFIACTWGGTCGRIDDRAALLSCAHQGVCVPLPYGADMDARMLRMVDSLLATNGTALRFAPPEPVAAGPQLRPAVYRRAS